jgi:integrase/recombinase XerD
LIGWPRTSTRTGISGLGFPVVFAFGEFAGDRDVTSIGELPARVDAFVEHRVARHHETTRSTCSMANEVRGSVEHMLAVVLAGYGPTGRKRELHPLADTVPDFFDYLVRERGLRPFTVRGYRIHLDHFETYLRTIGVESIREISRRSSVPSSWSAPAPDWPKLRWVMKRVR